MKKEKQDKRTNLRWNCRAKKLLHFPCSKCGGVLHFSAGNAHAISVTFLTDGFSASQG
jgi:hypothetical protein